MTQTARSLRARGFTLIEMIVVIAMIGLVMMMGYRSMSGALRASRARQAGQIVAADLEQAFTLAALQRRPVRIQWDAGAMTYTLRDRRTGAALLTRRIGTGDIGVGAASFSSNPVDVFPGGIASSQLRITLTSGASSHVVTMTRAGLVVVN